MDTPPAGHPQHPAASAFPAPGAAGPPPVVLARRADATVVRIGGTVAKAHAADCDRAALGIRLRVAAHPLLRGILLAPLPAGDGPEPLLGTCPDGRPVSRWPHGTPVDPGDPAAAPWEAAGELLARLHTVPVADLPGPLPPMRGPAGVARALAAMRREARSPAAVRAVEAAAATLPGWARGEEPPPRADALCHGDLHLGQFVRHPAPRGAWRLIDVDDLGLGDPAWDLARPAAWFAAGLLAPADFGRFLDAYRGAGGTALSGPGAEDRAASADPWPRLDAPARALTVQTAARALARAAAEGRGPDEVDRTLVDACSRIAQTR
ncbi:phosphotransferase family protein [Streptomyces desertarenae]|uniref:Phosphotransferase family protein n=1 Tax=Streptomyces desertarenae TaxID=2666184 RepID=A0ABW4PL74_9ACTN